MTNHEDARGTVARWTREARLAWALLALTILCTGLTNAADDPQGTGERSSKARFGMEAFWGSGSSSWHIGGFENVEGSFDGDASPWGFGLLVDNRGGGTFRYVTAISYEEWGDEEIEGDGNDPRIHLKTDGGLASDHRFDFDLVRRPHFRLALGGPGVSLEVLHNELSGIVGGFRTRNDQSLTRVDLGAGAQVTAGFPFSWGEVTVTGSYRYTRSVYEDFGAGPIDDLTVKNHLYVLKLGLLFGSDAR